MSTTPPPAAPDTAGDSDFELHLEIETPERVLIRYDLAGIGSRFAAGTIDALILFFVYMTMFIVVILVAQISLGQIEREMWWMIVGGLGVVLATTWLYYIGFELLWDGQTPGKRWLRLRVVSEGGGPASATAIFVRNLLRLADLAPVHLLGGIVMFISTRAKRIGDMAAGTVVVQEREVALDTDRLSRDQAGSLRERPREGTGEGGLSGADRARAAEVIARLRELRPDRRAAVARHLIEDIRTRYDLPDGDPVALVAALAEGTPPRDLMDRAGPQTSQAARPAEPSA